jgi:hypothetical protein
MFIPDPDFYPSRISDPGSNNKNKRGGRKIIFVAFFCSHQVPKIGNYFIFEQVSGTERIFSQLTKLQIYWLGIRDPRSGLGKKNLSLIPDKFLPCNKDPLLLKDTAKRKQKILLEMARR